MSAYRHLVREPPKRLTEMTGDISMFCGDYPHSEGTAAPLDDDLWMTCADLDMSGFRRANVNSLLHH
jgi:hypothetical protein